MRPELKAQKDFFMNIDMDNLAHIEPQEKVGLDRFARNWLQEALNQDRGDCIVDQLAALKAHDSEFKYRIFTDIG